MYLQTLREKTNKYMLTPPPSRCKLEGSWDDVMRLIGQAHVLLHQKGVLRIQTDIRVGSRLIFHPALALPCPLSSPAHLSSRLSLGTEDDIVTVTMQD